MSKKDLISLKNIESFSRLGVFQEERDSGQTIKVDLDIFLDLDKAAQSDDLEDTIDYAIASKSVQTTAQKKEFLLVEHLALEIIKDLFTHFSQVNEIKARVYKPTIITEGFSGEVSVELSRTRAELN